MQPKNTGHTTHPRGQKQDESGVSEVVATMLLISIMALGISIFTAGFLLQQSSVVTVPEITVTVFNDTEQIYIRHDGGDSLKAGEYHLFIGNVDHTTELTTGGAWAYSNGDDIWSAGETFSYDYSGSDLPRDVILVYEGNGMASVLYSITYGGEGVPPPGVIESTTSATTATTTAPTTTTTTVPTTTSTTVPTSTTTTVPTTATPTPTPHTSKLNVKAVDKHGDQVNIDIDYSGDKIGTKKTSFTVPNTQIGSSAFSVTLTPPENIGPGTSKSFSYWIVNGVQKMNRVTIVNVLDNSDVTATVYYGH